MSHLRELVYRIGRQIHSSGPDAAIAALASLQHGVVARWQMVELGVSDREIRRRLDAKRLHRVYPGVYAVGHRALSQRARWMAAVLACGDDAALSDGSAAALWTCTKPANDRIEVRATKAKNHPLLVVRRSILRPDEITTRDGIPVTTVPRTLLDLSATKHPRLERILREADVQRLLDWTQLEALLGRNTRTPGSAALRRLLASGRAISRSELEDRFRLFLLAENLPEPEYNATLELSGGRLEVDCLWREQRVPVELDGHQAHGTRAAFESDRERDRILAAAGFLVIRITWRQLRDAPAAVARDLRKLLCA